MADAIDQATAAQIRRWVGPLEHIEGLAGRVERLVEPAAVALEIAMERLGEMAMTDSTWRTGDQSTSRGKTDVEVIEALIGRLVVYLETSDDVSLNTAAEALVEQAQAPAGRSEISSVASTVTDARPG